MTRNCRRCKIFFNSLCISSKPLKHSFPLIRCPHFAHFPIRLFNAPATQPFNSNVSVQSLHSNQSNTSFSSSNPKSPSTPLLVKDIHALKHQTQKGDSSFYSELTPSQLVAELNKHIIGQNEAKKQVANGIRSRWRRHRVREEMRDEITPKNMLLLGPTGCGKTEIARRLAKLTNAPFIKVEATKYTEVGFQGKDVDSIISDLLKLAIAQLKILKRKENQAAIAERVENRILDALLRNQPRESPNEDEKSSQQFLSFKRSQRQFLREGLLDEQLVEISLPLRPPEEQGEMKILAGKNTKIWEIQQVKIKEAMKLLTESESEQMMNNEEIVADAIKSVENDGIVFIDEIDKLISLNSYSHADASSEGVQRDLLPLIEGTTVTTKHGDIKTDHILFICGGAFHQAKPSDLLSELQGRLPIRVQLKALTEEEMYQVLTNTQNNLIEQQKQLLKVDGVKLNVTDDAVRAIARVATELNMTIEPIGARRLHTVVELVMDELSFKAADMEKGTEIVIDQKYVEDKLTDARKKQDLRQFIL